MQAKWIVGSGKERNLQDHGECGGESETACDEVMYRAKNSQNEVKTFLNFILG